MRFQSALGATEYGSACYQFKTGLFNYSKSIIYDEDCLRLNIFAPDYSMDSISYPLMIWIHGGAFIAGISNSYDGAL